MASSFSSSRNIPLEVITTNSIPLDDEKKAQTSKVKQLSVGLMLSKLITAISSHQPVSEIYKLFEEHE